MPHAMATLKKQGDCCRAACCAHLGLSSRLAQGTPRACARPHCPHCPCATKLSPVPSVIPSTHSTPQWCPTAWGWLVSPVGNSCSALCLSWPRWLGSTAYPFLKKCQRIEFVSWHLFSKPVGIWCHGVKALSKVSESQPELTVYYLYTNEKYQLLLLFFPLC